MFSRWDTERQLISEPVEKQIYPSCLSGVFSMLYIFLRCTAFVGWLYFDLQFCSQKGVKWIPNALECWKRKERKPENTLNSETDRHVIIKLEFWI